jgi:hypothetical protein
MDRHICREGETARTLSLPSVVKSALRIGCPLPAVCRELRDAAREELRCAELAVAWGREARPSASLATLLRGAVASGRMDVAEALLRMPELARQRTAAMDDFARSGDLPLCDVFLRVHADNRVGTSGAFRAAVEAGQVEVCNLLYIHGVTGIMIDSQLAEDIRFNAEDRRRPLYRLRTALWDRLDESMEIGGWDNRTYNLVHATLKAFDWVAKIMGKLSKLLQTLP